MPGSPRPVRAVLAVIAVVGVVILSVVGLTTASSLASPVGHPTKTARANATVTQTVTAYVTAYLTATATATVTKTVTAAPTSSAPTSSAPTSPTATASPGGWACTVGLDSNCGAYQYAKIPMTNGYNTYVANQSVNPHGTVTVHANSPGDWEAIANLADCGGCVQTYNHITQLTNNWNGSGWGGSSGDSDTPLDALSTLTINYDETSPQSGASYEFAPDIWDDSYSGLNGPGSGDVMFWVDTKGRCNQGAFGPETLGHATIDGQTWTVHRWGSYGDEIIFVLDGPGGPGTCAQQSKGSINIKAGMDWLVAGGFIPAHPVLNQVNTGWEITQSSGATFTVHDYSITAN